MSTELTAVSTFGWYADESTHDIDLLTSVSTFGWYGVTLKDLIERYPTLEFGLIIDRLHEMGVEIEAIHEIENLEIKTLEELGNFEITQLLGINLKR
jgi:hypothetical protein